MQTAGNGGSELLIFVRQAGRERGCGGPAELSATTARAFVNVLPSRQYLGWQRGRPRHIEFAIFNMWTHRWCSASLHSLFHWFRSACQQYSQFEKSLSRGSNLLPVLTDLLGEFRRPEFDDRYRYVGERLGSEHSPKLGISRLPEPARSALLDMAYYFQTTRHWLDLASLASGLCSQT